MKKILLSMFFVALLITLLVAPSFSDISTWFMCADMPTIRMTFNIPENIEGTLKYYPMRLDINGNAKAANGASMPVNLHLNLGTLSDTILTPDQAFQNISDTDIKTIFAQFYTVSSGIDVATQGIVANGFGTAGVDGRYYWDGSTIEGGQKVYINSGTTYRFALRFNVEDNHWRISNYGGAGGIYYENNSSTMTTGWFVSDNGDAPVGTITQ